MYIQSLSKVAILFFIVIIASVMISCGNSNEKDQTTAQSTESQTDTGAVAFHIIVENSSQNDHLISTRNVDHCHDMRWITVTINDINHNPFLTQRFECSARHGTFKNVPADTYGSATLRGIHLDGDEETTFYFGEYRQPFTVEPGEKKNLGTISISLLNGLDLLADFDDDQYTYYEGDCDIERGDIYPGAVEKCNGIDDDCDGQVDEEALHTFYRDDDGDGFGTWTDAIQACSVPVGYTDNATDCNDTRAEINPDAQEVQCDCIDNDCAGGDLCPQAPDTYYADVDGDGYGNPAAPVLSAQEGVLNNKDCNDNAAAVHPGAEEICNEVDDNCDGQVDEGVLSTFYIDSDHDTYGSAIKAIRACTASGDYVGNYDDCNDGNADIHPGKAEKCNGLDDNCDGSIDEELTVHTYYQDADGDGYGIENQTIAKCALPDGYAADSGDCKDTDSKINPGATETCNTIDDNCDGQIDEGVKLTFYQDADGDNYGNPDVTDQACDAPQGFVADGGDCDDTRNTIYPGAAEVCNGLDDNCNDQIDDSLETANYYRDNDGDGYGDPKRVTQSCAIPNGYVADNTDCDDTETGADINPGANEVCNSIDDNCNNETDEGVLLTFYQDGDNDGYGVGEVTSQACIAPTGFASTDNDCNDNDASIHPNANEICGDGIDQDCNPTDSCVVTLPDVTNLTQAEAKAIILGAELSIGTWNWERKETITPGTVARQIPDAGTKVQHGTPVNLFLSNGKVWSFDISGSTKEKKIGPTINSLLLE